VGRVGAIVSLSRGGALVTAGILAVAALVFAHAHAPEDAAVSHAG
jgi:hypothetical protein